MYSLSTMNVTKINLHNRMEDRFLMNAIMLFIERNIVVTISTYSTINDFKRFKEKHLALFLLMIAL